MKQPLECVGSLRYLCEKIIRVLRPQRIILFSQKQDRSGVITAVKLCVIIPDGDSEEGERRLYLEVESDLPYDVLVYTEKEWEGLLASPGSFACRIQETGSVLYEED